MKRWNRMNGRDDRILSLTNFAARSGNYFRLVRGGREDAVILTAAENGLS